MTDSTRGFETLPTHNLDKQNTHLTIITYVHRPPAEGESPLPLPAI